ncbi:hypothetical protein Tco_0008191 [Tanacetum coccineum]
MTVKAEHLLMEFWPTIGDGVFVVGDTSVNKVKDLKVRLAYHCIAMTISCRKESTQRIIVIDLFYLYCIYGEWVIFHIPYWLVRYLRVIRDEDLMYGGMFVTRLAQSLRILTRDLMDVIILLAVHWEHSSRVDIKTLRTWFSSHSMIVFFKYTNEGTCYWLAMRRVREDDEVEEAAEEEAVGSSDAYWNMSKGDWQVCQVLWMDQQDERWRQLETWMTRQDERANWTYDHFVRQF